MAILKHKIICEVCSKEREVSLIIPRFCSTACRLASMRKKRKYLNKDNIINEENKMEEEIKTEPTNGEPNTTNGDPTPSNPEPSTTPTEPVSTENPSSVGQGAPAENQVDTPSQPTDNPGTI